MVIAISFDESGDNGTMVFKEGFSYFLFFELIFLEINTIAGLADVNL